MFEQVRDIVAETLRCDLEEVTMESRLAEDLKADSLDSVELNMSLEEALGVSVPDDELMNIKTVGDIVRVRILDVNPEAKRISLSIRDVPKEQR